jgi:ABC-type nickel/cobalt efflux system permease component RcnA
MNSQTIWLALTAGSVGFIHTLLGPDHYIPFIVLSKDRRWTMRKTMIITFLCGIGHVGSSILLAFLALTLGWSLTNIHFFEDYRGDIAGWLLIAFGLVYMIWGIRRAIKKKPHSHIHRHTDGSVHDHEHIHFEGHSHIHQVKESKSLTPWILFLIFVFGPCEPLIPIVMFPAANNNIPGLVGVILIFSLVTIITMMSIVGATAYGLKLINLSFMERYSNALAGGIILIMGIGVQFLGL